MITINLLPDEFRVKAKTSIKIPGLQIGIGAGLILALVTAIFYVDFLMVTSRYGKMNKKWKEIQPEYQALTQLQNEVDGKLKQEKIFMENFVTSQNALTHLLTWSSEYLPEAAWLTEIKLQRKGEGGVFLLKGLALSIAKQSSIEQIETYLHEFKRKMPDANLSLTTTRQTLEGIELTQFISNFEWGSKPDKPKK